MAVRGMAESQAAGRPRASGMLPRRERQARLVAFISLGVMAVEIAAGARFNSMALISDGLHTATHAGAMLLAAGAYVAARRCAGDPRYAFGAAKITDLAAFASGVALAVIAFFIGVESVERIIRPEPVRLGEAEAVAVLGLIVSGVSAILLRDGHAAARADRAGGHEHGDDLNIWAAYLHMLADVITSVLAIAALLVASWLRWTWLDPVVGLLNTAVVGAFALRLLRRASAVLLDVSPPGLAADIRRRLEATGDHVTRLRVWRAGPGRFAGAVTLSVRYPRALSEYRRCMVGLADPADFTIELEPQTRD